MKRIALVLIALLALAGCKRTEVNGIGSYTGDDDEPPQLDLATFAGCRVGEWGWVHGTGTVENRTADVATYEIVVAFSDDGTRVDTRSAWIRDLAAGATAQFDAARWFGENASAVDGCQVITVNRWEAETVA